MTRRKRTAKDFPPEFLDAWKLAVEGKLLLSMENIGSARNFIQQLYTFRKRLSEESPEIASPFFLVDLRVHDELGNVITGKPTRVPLKAIIKPYNPIWKDQIREQLSASERGVGDRVLGQVQLPELGVSHPPAAEEIATPDTLAETLSDLGYSTGEGK